MLEAVIIALALALVGWLVGGRTATGARALDWGRDAPHLPRLVEKDKGTWTGQVEGFEIEVSLQRAEVELSIAGGALPTSFSWLGATRAGRDLGVDHGLGDPAFDRAVRVEGDRRVALAYGSPAVRAGFLAACREGWSLHAGVLRVRLGWVLAEAPRDAATRGLELARTICEGPSELAERLAMNLAREPLAPLRLARLEALAQVAPGSPLLAEAAAQARGDADVQVRVLAGVIAQDREWLRRLAVDQEAPEEQRALALDALCEHFPTHRETCEVVAAWAHALPSGGWARVSLAKALADNDVPEREEVLVRLVEDGPDSVRLFACRALARRGTARSLGVLRPLKDRVLASELRDAASDAVLAIQARTRGGERGQLALVGEGGALSLVGQGSRASRPTDRRGPGRRDRR